MKIIKISQEITEQEDEVSVRDIFDKVRSDVAHYNVENAPGPIIDVSVLDEILKRHPSLMLLVKQYWLDFIGDNRAYLYKYVYPQELKNDEGIRNITQKLILEMYYRNFKYLVEGMIKHDETIKIFHSSQDVDNLRIAVYNYVLQNPELYKKHCPDAFKGSQWSQYFMKAAVSGFLDKIDMNSEHAILNSYKNLPPEIKTKNILMRMERFLVDLFFRQPYLYESDCPIDFKNNEKIINSRKTGWINLLNQKSPLLYGSLPEDLKQDKDFLKYRAPAKKILIEKLTHPEKETDSSIPKYIDMLVEEFRDEDFISSLFWKIKKEKDDMS